MVVLRTQHFKFRVAMTGHLTLFLDYFVVVFYLILIQI